LETYSLAPCGKSSRSEIFYFVENGLRLSPRPLQKDKVFLHPLGKAQSLSASFQAEKYDSAKQKWAKIKL
jgi:hypothetical protein